jgi:lipopolysaccharide transport system permease protein
MLSLRFFRSSFEQGRGVAQGPVNVRSLWRQRSLLWQLVKREVAGRYKGSFLGLVWTLVQPLLMLAVYTFVFGMVFESRWQGASGSKLELAAILFSGLLVFNLFAECVNRSPQLMLENANYVKRVVFPLAILPVVVMGYALFHAAMSIAVLSVFMILALGSLPWTVVLLPLIFLPLVLLVLGLSWALSALGVYFRDIQHGIGVLVSALLFLSPIFYPVSALPPVVQPYMFINPVAFIIEQVRGVVIWGSVPDWGGLGLYTAISAFVAWLGFVLFERARRGFADVL